MFKRACVFVAFAVAASAQGPSDKFSCGTMSLRDGPYNDRIAAAEQYVAAHPADVRGHVCLASGYLVRWIPGAQSPENDDVVRRAKQQFEAALALDRNETVSLSSLAKIAFDEAQPASDLAARSRAFDEAERWNRRLLEVDPKNKQAWYMLRVAAWARAYPEFVAARKRLGMKPADAAR
jgi:hypothetical protein